MDSPEIPQSDTQETPPPVETTPPPPTIKRTQRILFLLLVSLLILAVIAWRMQSTPSQPTETQQPAQTLQPLSTPTLNSTSTWISYTNTKYGYSFSYPAEWSILPLQAPWKEVVSIEQENPIYITPLTELHNPLGGPSISHTEALRVTVSDGNVSLSNFPLNDGQNRVEIISLGSNEAIKYTKKHQSRDGEDAPAGVYYYINKDNQYYSLSYVDFEVNFEFYSTPNEHLNTFDQILSTFEITTSS